MKKILVTGASGFLGGQVLALLAADERFEPLALLLPDDVRPLTVDVPIRRGDVRDYPAVRDACAGVDAVLHLAGVISYWRRDAGLLDAVNRGGVANVVRACRETGVRRLVHVSSVGAVGFCDGGAEADETQPFNWPHGLYYMQSKREGEELVLAAAGDGSLDAVVLNPASIMGPGDPDPNTPHNRLYASMYGRPFFFGSFAGGLAVVDARDLAAAVVAALEKGRSGERYLIVGANLEYRSVLRSLGARARKPVWPARLPPALLTAAGLAAELVAEITRKRPLLTAAYGRISGLRAYYSNRKSVAELGASYRPFAETVDAGCTYFEERFLGRGVTRQEPGAAGR